MKELHGEWVVIDEDTQIKNPLKHNPLCGGYRVDICDLCRIDTLARAAKAIEEEMFQVLSKPKE